MTPSVLLIAPDRSYRTGSYIKAANRLDIPLRVASWGAMDLPSSGHDLRIDSGSDSKSLKVINELNDRNLIKAVIPTDDVTVDLARKVGEMLALPINSQIAVKVSTNKLAFREFCRDHDFRTPKFQLCSADPNHEEVSFPCVAKPLTLSGSRGVIRCNNRQELQVAIERIGNLLQEEQKEPDGEILIEDFIAGDEYSIDAIVSDSVLEILAIFEKPDPLDGPFFEETIYVTPPRIPIGRVKQIENELQTVCDAIDLNEGPIHVELRVQNREIWILELASRTIGGRCGRIIEYQCGIPLEDLVLMNALRLPRPEKNKSSASGVMMIPVTQAGVLRRVEGINKARAVEGVVDVEIDCREGEILRAWPEGGAYPGFIFAAAESTDAVEYALRASYDCLKFVTAPLFQSKF
ncbi:ATP-grasp domain-containing protein [Arenicellales bacterium IMCC56312]